ncbi:hypothetical protein SAMN05421812_103216 [Asanoa hainanensis]|uniref:Uncharacterized protein n=1 Tax=Asanoa hainanensis TaxID=560556 RepID=A0A239K0F1_9ACTN|nr:hypothetical protein [Asanoa hainanensis]SNT11218.1 hypothetical protein SAMN05421812_103216 [Asanoa hainanensis]
MVWWGRAACPVRPVEAEWVDTSLDWLLAEFGDERLRGTVVLPNDEFFPGVYRGSRADVESVLRRLCVHMGVSRDRVELEHFANDEVSELSDHVPLNWASSGAAGHHRLRAGRSVIGIRDDQAAAPMALVATISHELGHVLLIGDGRVSADREDHEPLTDLLTVFFGLGIFGANAAFDYSVGGGYSRTSRLGYLTEPMFGYALARYAWLRGERNPAWAGHLDTNPRAFLKRGLRFLQRV